MDTLAAICFYWILGARLDCRSAYTDARAGCATDYGDELYFDYTLEEAHADYKECMTSASQEFKACRAEIQPDDLCPR